MSDSERKKRADRERKRRQRDKEKRLGIKVVEVKLSQSERANLDELCVVRGGVRGPYSVDEFISTLIRNDHVLLQEQLKRLGQCASCKKSLPEGCNGVFKGQAECWHTRKHTVLML
ncbi:hypothetical protein [Pseudoalteromonas sp. Of7M-16]|uniref:hypothetical protein n=1 Tax=Pseudoalteromonas sp. Of7M-16 TaxID=2917756 RepID=UPI001EF4A8B8|nr:hypothetical protein [Pseudoalteromonas sp. Of7M-16]MCG7551606.1 hypothetical protein [Pseudoalteromonas sp. Of7M-16]